MKVFVYTKSESKKIATLPEVSRVETSGNFIIFTSDDDVQVAFDTRVVKTTTFQN